MWSYEYCRQPDNHEGKSDYSVVAADRDLRIQKERGSQAVVDPLMLKDFGKRTKLMHPGPATIGEEISAELADFGADYSLVYDQVKAGLQVRTEILAEVLQYSAAPTRKTPARELKGRALGMRRGQ